MSTTPTGMSLDERLAASSTSSDGGSISFPLPERPEQLSEAQSSNDPFCNGTRNLFQGARALHWRTLLFYLELSVFVAFLEIRVSAWRRHARNMNMDTYVMRMAWHGMAYGMGHDTIRWHARVHMHLCLSVLA